MLLSKVVVVVRWTLRLLVLVGLLAVLQLGLSLFLSSGWAWGLTGAVGVLILLLIAHRRRRARHLDRVLDAADGCDLVDAADVAIDVVGSALD